MTKRMHAIRQFLRMQPYKEKLFSIFPGLKTHPNVFRDFTKEYGLRINYLPISTEWPVMPFGKQAPILIQTTFNLNFLNKKGVFL